MEMRDNEMGLVPFNVAATKETEKYFSQECVKISKNNETMDRDSNKKSTRGKYVNETHPIEIRANIKRDITSS